MSECLAWTLSSLSQSRLGRSRDLRVWGILSRTIARKSLPDGLRHIAPQVVVEFFKLFGGDTPFINGVAGIVNFLLEFVKLLPLPQKLLLCLSRGLECSPSRLGIGDGIGVYLVVRQFHPVLIEDALAVFRLESHPAVRQLVSRGFKLFAVFAGVIQSALIIHEGMHDPVS